MDNVKEISPDSLNINDVVLITINGVLFYDGIYLGTDDYAGTGHTSNMVEVKIDGQDSFIDYFDKLFKRIESTPIEKLPLSEDHKDIILACKRWYSNEDEETIIGIKRAIEHISGTHAETLTDLDIREWLFHTWAYLAQNNVMNWSMQLEEYFAKFSMYESSKLEFLITGIRRCKIIRFDTLEENKEILAMMK